MRYREEPCAYCGRFISWDWRVQHACFAGDERAFCPWRECQDRAYEETAEGNARRARRRAAASTITSGRGQI